VYKYYNKTYSLPCCLWVYQLVVSFISCTGYVPVNQQCGTTVGTLWEITVYNICMQPCTTYRSSLFTCSILLVTISLASGIYFQLVFVMNHTTYFVPYTCRADHLSHTHTRHSIGPICVWAAHIHTGQLLPLFTLYLWAVCHAAAYG